MDFLLNSRAAHRAHGLPLIMISECIYNKILKWKFPTRRGSSCTPNQIKCSVHRGKEFQELSGQGWLWDWRKHAMRRLILEKAVL